MPSTATCPHCLASLDLQLDSKPSPVPSDLLETNRPPTDPEILDIHSAIDEKRAQKMCLEARIAAVQSLLEKLRVDCNNLDDDIQAHERTLSSLRRMPIELLSLIFVFASRFKYLEPTPWTASQVCHLWRTVALSQSLMSEMDRKTSTPFRLKAQLKRSGTLPLRIDFACRYKFASAKQELVLLDILAQHSTRWETVRLFACIRGNLPLLCKLQVLCHPPDPDNKHPVDVFEFAPNLRDVTVNMEGFHEDPVHVLLPFPRLQQHAARNMLDSHLRTLASASNRVECALDVDHSSDISVPPAKLVTLPHLLRLFLQDSKLWDCLDTPQLEELYCSSQSNHLLSLFKRQPPQHLRKLVLFFPTSVPDISDILRWAPAITDLDVCVPAESFDDLNTSLILRNEPTDVGLALRSIERLGQFLFRRYNQNILVDMLTLRWRAGAGELCLINVPDGEFDMRDERLDELESEGLVFTSSFNDAHIGMVPEHLQFKSSYWWSKSQSNSSLSWRYRVSFTIVNTRH
ncbi:hypothetical protein B0H14DRAFT_3078223 [Mycena olivaceomarginata]|nr:hypothetical protein B0H14DRAFT_3078223 [Mycena olivaceomarginata]